ERHDLVEPTHEKPPAENGKGRLRSNAATPIPTANPPSYLHAGGEVSCERRHHQANASNEFPSISPFGGEHPEPIALQPLGRAVHERNALLTGHRRWKVTHDLRVRVHRGHCRKIVGRHWPKVQTRSNEAHQALLPITKRRTRRAPIRRDRHARQSRRPAK